MADQNNAAEAAEQEIDAIMEQAQVFASAWSFLGGPFDNGSGLETAERERAALRTMLSKLRVEGVQASDEESPPIAPNDEAISECWIIASDSDGIAYDGPSFERGYRAALASAPVAGEAIQVATRALQLIRRSALDAFDREQHDKLVQDFAALLEGSNAAPQASEAVCSCPTGNGSLRWPCAAHRNAEDHR
ncbi:MAG: hypothetical protein ACN6OP_08695 [Pseudomonadales bacterium]